MFDANFKDPFADALDTVMQIVQFPPDGVLDEELAAAVKGTLQGAVLEGFKPIQNAQGKGNKLVCGCRCGP